jgi:hypothetical protein
MEREGALPSYPERVRGRVDGGVGLSRGCRQEHRARWTASSGGRHARRLVLAARGETRASHRDG